MSAQLATVLDKGTRSPPKTARPMFGPSAVLITETNPTRRSSGACHPTLPGHEHDTWAGWRWRSQAGPVRNRK